MIRHQVRNKNKVRQILAPTGTPTLCRLTCDYSTSHFQEPEASIHKSLLKSSFNFDTTLLSTFPDACTFKTRRKEYRLSPLWLLLCITRITLLECKIAGSVEQLQQHRKYYNSFIRKITDVTGFNSRKVYRQSRWVQGFLGGSSWGNCLVNGEGY